MRLSTELDVAGRSVVVCGGSAAALGAVVDLHGAERVALGTDYPFPLGEPVPGQLIEACEDLDEHTRDRLLAGTALEFLGLPRARFP